MWNQRNLYIDFIKTHLVSANCRIFPLANVTTGFEGKKILGQVSPSFSFQIRFCWSTQRSSGWTLRVAQTRLWRKCGLHTPANLQTNGMEILNSPLFLNSSGMKFYTKFKRFVFWHLFHAHQVKHLICRAAACVFPTRVLFSFNYVVPLRHIIRGRLKKSRKSVHVTLREMLFPNLWVIANVAACHDLTLIYSRSWREWYGTG